MLSKHASRRIGSPPNRVALRSAFGAGQFAKSLAWYLIDLLLAYYANARLGLPAWQTGLLLFLSMALGALADVGAAILLRHLEGDRYRIILLQLVAGLASAAALLLIFVPMPDFLTPFLRLVATVTLFRSIHAFYDLAQNALTSLLPQDEKEAHHFAVWRQIAITAARIGVAGLAFLIVGNGAPAVGQKILITGAIALLIASTAVWIARWAGSATPRPASATRRSLTTPAGLAPLLLAAAAMAGPIALLPKLIPFVDGTGFGGRTGAILLLALMLGTVIGPLTLPAPRGSAVRTGIAFTATTLIAAAVLLADLRVGEAAMIACFAYGLGAGGMLALFWRALSLAIRDHAHRTDIRTDMAAFALVTAVTKLAGAASGAGLGLLLDGFKAGNPAAMAQLFAVIVAGGICFLAAMMPVLRIEARQA